MDELIAQFRRIPRWFVLLLGLALAALVVQALITGIVETPSSYAFLRSHAGRAEQPGTYWALVLAYAALAALFLFTAWRRYRAAQDVDYEPPPPPPPQPPWARALAWIGVVAGVLLTAAGVWCHFTLDAIISLPFVAFFGGSGLFIGMASAGYLATGRLQ